MDRGTWQATVHRVEKSQTRLKLLSTHSAHTTFYYTYIPHFLYPSIRFYLFVLGCTGSSLLCAGFLWLQQVGAAPQLRCVDFSSWWFLLLRSTGFIVVVSPVEEHRLQCSCLQQSWRTGLPTPQHLESSQTGERTCIGRWTLNHWTTVEVLFIHQLMDI